MIFPGHMSYEHILLQRCITMAEDSCCGARGCRRRWMAPATLQQPRAKKTFKLRRALVLHRSACVRGRLMQAASWHWWC